MKTKRSGTEQLGAFNVFSLDAQKLITEFAKNVCSAMEVQGFFFPVRLLLDKGYGLEEILKLKNTLSSILNPGLVIVDPKKWFNVEIIMEFSGTKVAMNFSDASGGYYDIWSKTYLDDTHKLPKNKIALYLDDIIFIGNAELLSKLRNFLAKVNLHENRLRSDSSDTYIVKDGEDFKYKGALLGNLGKETNYYKVFYALYMLLPTGGFETYENIGKEVKSLIPKSRNFNSQKMTKFIQSNLDTHNGFLHHAKKVENTLPGGKELIHIVRGKGVEFNNKKGSGG